MASQNYQRFAISVPPIMAKEIEQLCRSEGRSRSEFFREAVRVYISATRGAGRPAKLVMPSGEEERLDNPFHTFTEWESEADAAYDVLR